MLISIHQSHEIRKKSPFLEGREGRVGEGVRLGGGSDKSLAKLGSLAGDGIFNCLQLLQKLFTTCSGWLPNRGRWSG